MRILLFEDHCRLAESIIKGLAGLGLGVDGFQTAADGLSAFKSIAYDAVILDLGLPDLDGLDVLRELRQRNLSIPVLILTARDNIDARVTGLDSGADDYLGKPFVMKELAARLRALLRRPGRALGEALTIANLEIQTASRQVTVNRTPVRFPVREIEALEILMRKEGQVVPRDKLEDALYGLNKNVTPNSIEVLISRLRRRLASNGADCSIHTLYGIGYLLRENTH